MSESLWPQVILAASTLAAAFLGFVLAGINEARRDSRAAQRERDARAEERQSVSTRERHQFQLDTLLALQDAVQLMARLTGRAMHFDHMQARRAQYTQLPPEHDDEILANRFDVIRLRNRLLDQELRFGIEGFESECVAATLSPTHYEGLVGDALESEAAATANRFGRAYTSIMESLGEALRAELAWAPPGH